MRPPKMAAIVHCDEMVAHFLLVFRDLARFDTPVMVREAVSFRVSKKYFPKWIFFDMMTTKTGQRSLVRPVLHPLSLVFMHYDCRGGRGGGVSLGFDPETPI